MQLLDQQFRFVVENLVERGFGHADGHLRVIDDHRVIPTHSQSLAFSNTAARKQLQGQRLTVIMPRVKIRILQRRIILAFSINHRAVLAAHGHGCAGPPEHVNRADLFDAPVVQPKLAGFAAPKPRIKRDLVIVEAVEEHRQLPPVAGGGHVKLARRQLPLARQHQHAQGIRRLQALGLHPERKPVTAMWLHPDRLHYPPMSVRVGGKILQAQ